MSSDYKRIWRMLALVAVFAYGLFMVGCGSTEQVAPTAVAEAEAAVVADDHEAEQEEAHQDEHESEDQHADEDDHEHEDEHEHEDDHEHAGETAMLQLPALAPLSLEGRPLQVVATTSIIGDVVAQVGGEAIALTTLMGAGQDPHSYEPAARDLTAVADADVIFVNGWNLEEALTDNLETIGEGTPVVAVSANIDPLPFGGEEADGHEEEAGDEHEHDHAGADPHVWFSIHNVEQWVTNVAQVLSELDPANATTYADNATAYLGELADLEAFVEEQLGSIPDGRRYLVTNHGAFGYFAHEYSFEVLGTVIPAMSTLAEPSASDLADLIRAMEEHGVCTIFTETTVSDSLAQTVAAEVSGCEQVQVLKLFTGAIGPAGSGADSFIGMFRANVEAIAAGLR